MPLTAKPGFRYHGGRIRHLPLGRRGMEEKPKGALAVILVLTLLQRKVVESRVHYA